MVQRSTMEVYKDITAEERYNLYGLREYVRTNHSLLDLGCNEGAMSIYASEFCEKTLGVDKNSDFIFSAVDYAIELGRRNALFIKSDIDQLLNKEVFEKFDIVLALRIHKWIETKFEDLIPKLYNILNDNGILVFESHNIETEDKNIDEKKEVLLKYFTILQEGGYVDSRECLTRPIPRVFFTLKKRSDIAS